MAHTLRSRMPNVRTQSAGVRVDCEACGLSALQAKFEACDPTSAAYPPMESGLSLLARAHSIDQRSRMSLNDVADILITSAKL